MAWFIAGEGYINLAVPNAKKKWYPSLRVGFVNTERVWADIFHAHFGGFIWLAPPHKNQAKNRFGFGWRVTGKQAEVFLKAILPYLCGEKRPQALLGLRLCEDKRRFYRKTKINTETALWMRYLEDMKQIRRAAAETNRSDAALFRRSDSPTPSVMGD